MRGLVQDLRYSVRRLGGRPGFTVAAVVTLALGIGANTAIFTLFDGLMLRWLPVPNAQELVQLKLQIPDERTPNTCFSYAIVRALADQKEIFVGVGGFSGFSFTTGDGDTISKLPGALVTGGFYDTLAMVPVAGRLLSRVDDQPGALPSRSSATTIGIGSSRETRRPSAKSSA
jgi:putative ABC transport system permease protein